MAMLSEMYDRHDDLVCRYCRFARYLKESDNWICTAAEEPGAVVVPDIAECTLGEKVGEEEEYTRKRCDKKGIQG